MRRSVASWALGVLLAGLAATAGCSCPQTAVGLDTLLAEYNANAAAVPRLAARARVRVRLQDPDSPLAFTWDSQDPTAILLLGKREPGQPQDFVLVGREAGQDIFRIGSDGIGPADGEPMYYFWYQLGDRGEAWWALHKNAGAPGLEGPRFDPNQLLAVLSVCELPADLTDLPAVTLELHAEPGRCAYVVSYLDRQPVTRRILQTRKVYFDWDGKPPRRPFRVDFLDPNGRRVATASLKDYRPIALEHLERPGAREAVLPTDITLTWIDPRTHEKGSSIHLWLQKMTTEDRWLREAVVFNPPPGVPVRRLDARVSEGGRPE